MRLTTSYSRIACRCGPDTAVRQSTDKENNAWAICTDSVGRDDKEKYEKCVMSIKKKNHQE